MWLPASKWTVACLCLCVQAHQLDRMEPSNQGNRTGSEEQQTPGIVLQDSVCTRTIYKDDQSKREQNASKSASRPVAMRLGTTFE